MKSQSSFTGSSAWLLGRTQSNPADRLLQRVRAVTHELEAIQNEMCSQLADTDGTPRKNGITPDSAAASDLQVFKTMVDQMRRILWFYREEAAGKPAVAGVDQEQQEHRVQRVTELLRSLSPPPTTPAAALAGEESGSFFERLNLVIDNYMQEKKPVAAEPKTAPRTNAKAFS